MSGALIVKSVEVRTARYDKVILLSGFAELLLLFFRRGIMISLNTVNFAVLRKLFKNLGLIIHHRVSHYSNAL